MILRIEWKIFLSLNLMRIIFGIIYNQRETKTNNLKAKIVFLPTSDFVAWLAEVPTHNRFLSRTVS